MAERNVAIILAGGKGKRMNTDIPKQYLEIEGKPLICYTIEIFEKSFIDEIVVVTGVGEIEWFQTNIVDKYGYNKVRTIVEGGKERYHSVMNGLNAIEDTDYVYIHDGARPCVDEEVLEKGRTAVQEHMAVVAAVPVKDTIKIISDVGKVVSTPSRNQLWQIQTPQIFSFHKIKEAYKKMISSSANDITDDAMVMENYGDVPVYVFEGKYNNIKVTTPEDMEAIKNILKNI